MPWCPKCKTEYREDFTECTDCNVALVDQLEEIKTVPFFQTEKKSLAEKLVQYFAYSGLDAGIQFDEGNEVYVVSVPAAKQSQAKKLYQAFYLVEIAEQEEEKEKALAAEEGIAPDEEDQTPDVAVSYEETPDLESNNATMEEALQEDEVSDKKAAAYVMKADQYKDLNSTVWIFLIFGIAGMVVIFLNLADILGFINGIISYVVFAGLSLFFIYVGLSTQKNARKIKAEIDDENKLTEDINQWLKLNITEHYLSSLHNDAISEELNYIKKTEQIKNMLVKNFGSQNDAYLDYVIENFYSSTFEGNES